MSRSAAFIVLLMALISGLFASFTVMKYIKNGNKEPVKNTVSVVVAKEQIPAGSAVLSEQMELMDREKETIPVGAFETIDQLKDRVARTTIYPGEVILQDRLIKPGTPGGLPALIPEGYRAITVRVDDAKSVAGFVRPGHHIDLIVTVDVEESVKRETKSKVILQNIKVLATGQEIEMNDNEEGSAKKKQTKVVPTVTLLVTLEQAERVTLASSAGNIRLILRSHTDENEEYTDGVTLTNLIARSKNPLPEPTEIFTTPPEIIPEENTMEEEKRPIRVVQVFRGSEKTEVTFQ